MLLIKIFEWHGVSQEAIVYTNSEAGNTARADRLSVYLHRSAKVQLYAIRKMMKVLICGIHSTFLQLTSDRLCLSALTLYIATTKEVMRTETHH